jgi:uncharacterized membrane protein
MRNNRIVSLDLFRGLVMVIMAIDHTIFFVAKLHYFEFWDFPLPHLSNTVSFITRLATHICAIGFFLWKPAWCCLWIHAAARDGWGERSPASF